MILFISLLFVCCVFGALNGPCTAYLNDGICVAVADCRHGAKNHFASLKNLVTGCERYKNICCYIYLVYLGFCMMLMMMMNIFYKWFSFCECSDPVAIKCCASQPDDGTASSNAIVSILGAGDTLLATVTPTPPAIPDTAVLSESIRSQLRAAD
jgi:hypothetical protein